MQVKLVDLVRFIDKCKKEGVPLDTPVYLGNDDELNGVHCAWGIDLIKKNNDEDDNIILELIDESFGNLKAKDINILIS